MFAIACITKRGSQLQVGWLPARDGLRGYVATGAWSMILPCVFQCYCNHSVCVKEKEKEKKERDDLFSFFCLIFLKECWKASLNKHKHGAQLKFCLSLKSSPVLSHTRFYSNITTSQLKSLQSDPELRLLCMEFHMSSLGLHWFSLTIQVHAKHDSVCTVHGTLWWTTIPSRINFFLNAHIVTGTLMLKKLYWI